MSSIELIELSEKEIELVAGGGEIDPPRNLNGDDFPEIENVPPPA